MDETEEKQEYIHQINDLPIAGSHAVPESPLAAVIDSKVKDVLLSRSGGDSDISLVDAHVAKISETTPDEITSIIAALN